MRNNSGVILLEVMVAVVILATAGIALVNNTHTCAPRPDWEISIAAGTPLARAALL